MEPFTQIGQLYNTSGYLASLQYCIFLAKCFGLPLEFEVGRPQARDLFGSVSV